MSRAPDGVGFPSMPLLLRTLKNHRWGGERQGWHQQQLVQDAIETWIIFLLPFQINHIWWPKMSPKKNNSSGGEERMKHAHISGSFLDDSHFWPGNVLYFIYFDRHYHKSKHWWSRMTSALLLLPTKDPSMKPRGLNPANLLDIRLIPA